VRLFSPWRFNNLVESGRLTLVTGFVDAQEDALTVSGHGASATQTLGPVDRIIVATGQRPDLE
jgi:hypothetical protein